MKFKFTTTPLKDLPLGSVVDGYKLTGRSYTGNGCFAHRVDADGFPTTPREKVLLLCTNEQPVEEQT